MFSNWLKAGERNRTKTIKRAKAKWEVRSAHHGTVHTSGHIWEASIMHWDFGWYLFLSLGPFVSILLLAVNLFVIALVVACLPVSNSKIRDAFLKVLSCSKTKDRKEWTVSVCVLKKDAVCLMRWAEFPGLGQWFVNKHRTQTSQQTDKQIHTQRMIEWRNIKHTKMNQPSTKGLKRRLGCFQTLGQSEKQKLCILHCFCWFRVTT